MPVAAIEPGRIVVERPDTSTTACCPRRTRHAATAEPRDDGDHASRDPPW